MQKAANTKSRGDGKNYSNFFKGVQEKPRSKLKKQNFQGLSMLLEQELYGFVVT